MRVIAIIAAAVVLLTGCSGSKETPAASQPPASSVPATVVEPTSPPASSEEPRGYSAAEVLAAFKAAKLPVRNARDNSTNCESMQLGCLEMLTTDDVSITTWGDAVTLEAYAQAYGKEAFVANNVVLSYAGARTPAKMRPKYQAALTALVGS